MWTKIKRSEEELENSSKSQGIQEVESRLSQKSAQIAATEQDSRQELSVGLVQFDRKGRNFCGSFVAIRCSKRSRPKLQLSDLKMLVIMKVSVDPCIQTYESSIQAHQFEEEICFFTRRK